MRVPLAALLPLLSNVSRLTISWPYTDMGWVDIPVDFRAVLLGLLSLPSLRCVAFRQCTGLPPSIIRHALASCAEVSLKDVGISSENNGFQYGGETTLPSTSPLHRLAVWHTQRFHLATAVQALVLEDATPRLENIRYLKFDVPRTGSLAGFEVLALQTSVSLQHLLIHFQCRSQTQFLESKFSHMYSRP
ncbi:hypothetical protein B0H17DRAFT_333865 [Mycena rosella]|uniref:Uncharacterized protein n=1 Tax=Mycena rosella TaxID=1033263 RepID=A0AAD7G527_MYCRO|nr:hypothetical protein B0H17DRAFT_333865 [Mycena rosella]